MNNDKVLGLKKQFLLYFSALLVLACLLFRTSLSQASEPDQLTLLIEEAMSNNLEISSLAEKARALRAEAPYAGSLPDPRITLALSNIPTDSFDFDQEPMTQKQIGFAQQLPWFGTLDLKEQKAEILAQEQEALVLAKRFNVTRQLKEAWYQLGFIGHSLQTNSKLTELVEQILRIAENRYSTGKGLQQDILLAQIQLSEFIDKKITLDSQKRQLQDRIGDLLDREHFFSAEGGEVALPRPLSGDKDLLTSIAMEKNPLLEARRSKVMAAELDVQLAEQDYMPNMDFRLSYGQRDDDPTTGRDRADFFSAGITFSVPLWQETRQDSKYDGSTKRLLSAKKSLRSLETSLPHRIDALLTSINEAHKSYELFHQAINIQTSQLADASLASYSVGKLDFESMLTARMKGVRVELQVEQYKYRIYQKIAELEETVGTSLHTNEEQK